MEPNEDRQRPVRVLGRRVHIRRDVGRLHRLVHQRSLAQHSAGLGHGQRGA